MRTRLNRAGIKTSRHIFGMADSGRMTLDRTLEFVKQLPEGDTEIRNPANRSQRLFLTLVQRGS